MRDVILLLAIVAALGITLRFPFAGVLLWAWFALQNPHDEVYGFMQTLPSNLVIAGVTVLAWLLSKERKTPPMGPLFWAIAVFLLWCTFNSFFAYDPAWSWPYWDRTWKTFALGLMIAATATSRVRIQAVLWIAVISLFYYGVKGGVFTILTGGHNHVFGPPNTIIADNNQLAVALLMALPLANYLRLQTKDKRIGYLLLAGTVFTIIAVLGTYSRGALIGLGALGCFMLLRMRGTRRKILYLVGALALVVFVVHFMPDKFFHRMDTITAAQQDESFQGRITAWKVAFFYAADHFPFGAGFYGPQLPPLFHSYFPDSTPHAAHSIYFQVLGENGFIGLAIYLFIIAASFLRCSKLISASRRLPDRQWLTELAIALQASLFVFFVSGAALSMAYYDLFVIEVALLLPLREMALPKAVRPAWAPVPQTSSA